MQIIKQPNGLYALWSGVCYDFSAFNLTTDDVIAYETLPQFGQTQTTEQVQYRIDNASSKAWDVNIAFLHIVHRGIDWVIVGGESGHDARPMNPEWAQSLRDQCVEAGVAFFFKQWGAWVGGWSDMGDPFDLQNGDVYNFDEKPFPDAKTHVWKIHRDDDDNASCRASFRVGKAQSGRLLDGRTWDELPEVQA